MYLQPDNNQRKLTGPFSKLSPFKIIKLIQSCVSNLAEHLKNNLYLVLIFYGKCSASADKEYVRTDLIREEEKIFSDMFYQS